jgi:hypothetical protein
MVLLEVRVRDVDDVNQKIGYDHFFQRALKASTRLCGRRRMKADRVR